MRKRVEARKLWDLKVYRYRCYPEVEPSRIPSTPLWEEAERMRDYWNRLVGLAEENRQQYEAILKRHRPYANALAAYEIACEQQQQAWAVINAARASHRTREFPDAARLEADYQHTNQLRKEAAILLKAATKVARQQQKNAIESLQEEWNHILRLERQTDVMQYGNREFVLDHFKPALAKARKEGARLHLQGRITDMNFYHQFPGGITWEKLTRPRPAFVGKSMATTETAVELSRTKRLSIGEFHPTDKTHTAPHWDWVMQVGNDFHLPLSIAYHRPIPPGSLVKSIVLNGRELQREGVWCHKDGHYAPARGRWEWHVILAIEIDPEKQEPRPARSAAACGIDLGWRRMDDGSLRVAVLSDDQGDTEELRLPVPLMQKWQHLQDVQADISNRAEEVTTKIKALPTPQDPDARLMINAWRHTSVPNLWKLYNLIQEKALVVPHGPVLQEWAYHQTKLQREHSGGFAKLGRWRLDIYRKWAISVCRRYTTIAMEELDLKKMAEEKDKAYRLARSMEMRQLASIYSLTQTLVYMAKKWGVELTKRNPAYTTLTCPTCGVILDKNTGDLILVCPQCGAARDQDSSAATLIQHAPLAAAS